MASSNQTNFRSMSRNTKLGVAALCVVVLGIILFLVTGGSSTPPTNTEYKSKEFTFSYPRVFTLEEFPRGAVAVGTEEDGVFLPYVEVVKYYTDPNVPLPASRDAFVRQQAQNLCGADSGETVDCTDPVITPYVSPAGYVGQQVSLTLTRTSVTSGTTTIGSYGPMFVFDITLGAAPSEDRGERYDTLFIYPGLRAVLAGAPISDALDTIMATFTSPTIPVRAPAVTP